MDPKFAELKPRKKEKFTHKVRFSQWRTKFELNIDKAKEVNERAKLANIQTTPCDAQNLIDGSIRIWDFGGQEIYHQTHRLFAAEGSVYLLVWSHIELNETELMRDKPRGVGDDEWREWNRRRSLDYWLDYVDSIRKDARIALVCTSTQTNSAQTPWTTRSEKHKGRELPCFYIDSLEDACAENPQYRSLVRFIRSASGAEATRIGILQPSFYAEVSNYVDRLLAENDGARRDPNRTPQHLLLTYDDWTQRLSDNHRQLCAANGGLDAGDIESITGYLHDAGHVFYIRDHKSPAVMIDQAWATDLIYEMLRPKENDEDFCLFNVIRSRGGYFDDDVLKLDAGSWTQSGKGSNQMQNGNRFCNTCSSVEQ